METDHLKEEKERILWKQAKKRVGFKKHALTYLAVNTLFWVMWYFTGRNDNEGGLPWPTFCTLGWGFGLCWHFLGAYVMADKVSAIEKEFQRLKDRQNS